MEETAARAIWDSSETFGEKMRNKINNTFFAGQFGKLKVYKEVSPK
jgi:hypothetical protein